MIRRPPRSTRTDTLFPYTTLFRSAVRGCLETLHGSAAQCQSRHQSQRRFPAERATMFQAHADACWVRHLAPLDAAGSARPALRRDGLDAGEPDGTCCGRLCRCVRSEERRVGKECVSTCRSRWSPSHSKKKNIKSIVEQSLK